MHATRQVRPCELFALQLSHLSAQGRVPNTPYNTPAHQLKTSAAQSPLHTTDENILLHVSAVVHIAFGHSVLHALCRIVLGRFMAGPTCLCKQMRSLGIVVSLNTQAATPRFMDHYCSTRFCSRLAVTGQISIGMPATACAETIWHPAAAAIFQLTFSISDVSLVVCKHKAKSAKCVVMYLCMRSRPDSLAICMMQEQRPLGSWLRADISMASPSASSSRSVNAMSPISGVIWP